MPAELLDPSGLLPQDQRYYQFLGSLTTPPCTEGVLWMVLKTPSAISREQIKLFSQLFPNNARPVQPLNNRPVREAQ
jgi:carbonic anhydrase